MPLSTRLSPLYFSTAFLLGLRSASLDLEFTEKVGENTRLVTSFCNSSKIVRFQDMSSPKNVGTLLSTRSCDRPPASKFRAVTSGRENENMGADEEARNVGLKLRDALSRRMSKVGSLFALTGRSLRHTHLLIYCPLPRTGKYRWRWKHVCVGGGGGAGGRVLLRSCFDGTDRAAHNIARWVLTLVA